MVRAYLPQSELDREDVWLDAIESGASTSREIAAQTGYTQRRIQQRVAAARQRRDKAHGDAAGDLHDLPWVELVDGRQAAGPYYDLVTDRLEKPAGAFRIGTRNGGRLKVQHAGNGKPVEQPKQSEHKFQPKRPKRKRA